MHFRGERSICTKQILKGGDESDRLPLAKEQEPFLAFACLVLAVNVLLANKGGPYFCLASFPLGLGRPRDGARDGAKKRPRLLAAGNPRAKGARISRSLAFAFPCNNTKGE